MFSPLIDFSTGNERDEKGGYFTARDFIIHMRRFARCTSFTHFKKREKNTHGGLLRLEKLQSSVCNFIPKTTLLHWCFWCFLNRTNGTKSQKSYHRFNIFNSGNTTSRLVTLKVKQNVLGTVLTNWSICDCKLNVCIWLKKTSNINKSHMYIDL